jgi:hypothetical protein
MRLPSLPQLPQCNAQAVLAVVVVVAFIALVAVWMVEPPQADDKIMTMVNALVMMVGTGFLTVVNYYFGSSAGSKDKDEVIARATLPPAEIPAPPPAAPAARPRPSLPPPPPTWW